MGKKLYVPTIKGLEKMDDTTLLKNMEEKGARFYIDCVNWPDAYPYAPLAGGEAALGNETLAVHFHVRGMDLRAMNLRDNDHQWEDSCCEVFIADPDGSAYYNFETNCAGYVLAGIGGDRHDRGRRSSEEMARIRRIRSSEFRESVNYEGDIYVWDVAILIPLDMVGAKSTDTLRANFYKCADKSAHPHFLSWNPIDTPRPDFHRPEFFGELVLQR